MVSTNYNDFTPIEKFLPSILNLPSSITFTVSVYKSFANFPVFLKNVNNLVFYQSFLQLLFYFLSIFLDKFTNFICENADFMVC